MTHTIDDQLESLSNNLREVQYSISQLKDAESDIKARIRDSIGDQRGTITAFGKPVLNVTYRRVFNEEEARRVLASKPELLALLEDTTINASRAKALLAPAVYQLCQVESTNASIAPAKAAS